MTSFIASSVLLGAVFSIVGSASEVGESPGPEGVSVSISHVSSPTSHSLTSHSLTSHSLTSHSLTSHSLTSWKAGCLAAPVPGPIVRFFQEPDCPYCAGHRTVDFAIVVGDVIRSPVAGRVSFSGFVAGVGYVTVVPFGDPSHLVTVGGVVPGAISGRVATGDHIGTAQGPRVVRLSVRQTQVSGLKTYRDPEPLLARWRVRARLVEFDVGDGRRADGQAGNAQFGDIGAETAGPRRPGRAEYGCRPE